MSKEKWLFDYTNRYQNLAFAISYYRKKRNLTQEQLAEMAGVTRQHIGSIEAPNMYRGISMDAFFNIASILEVEPYLLLKFNPEE